MKVVIAPDSFKGSISNVECAEAIAEGWRSVRAMDQISLRPMADGGEGTLETIAFQYPQALRLPAAVEHQAWWLLLADGTAYVELASICGITLLEELDPLHSNTYLLGLVLRDISSDPRVEKIVISVGGSASTDGGAGILIALGARLLDSNGAPIPLGGGDLSRLHSIDLSEVVPAPRGGIVCLTDVTNPLLGEFGAAHVYSPQKGATPEDVLVLAKGLERLLEVSGNSDFPGAGAAGGTPFGLSLAWGARIESGALAIAELIGVPEVIETSDVVITGEGRLDSQSEFGKVVGTVKSLARKKDKDVLYCVGSSEVDLETSGVALVDIAPSLKDAISNPRQWLIQAGKELALRYGN